MAADAKQSPALFDPTAFQTFRFVEPRARRARPRDAALRARRGDLSSLRSSTCRSSGGVREADRERRGRPALAAALGGGRELLQDGAAAERQLRDGRAPAGRRGAAGGALLGGPRRVRVHQRASPALPRPRFPRRAAAGAPPAPVAREPATRARSSACWCRWAAARTRRWRSRSCAARAWSWRCSRWATRRRSRARSRWRACRGCWPGARSTRQLAALNEAGAINGHVPITAIVSCVALLTAALNGFDAVAMANERSASAGNVTLGRRGGQPPVQQEPARGAAAERGGRGGGRPARCSRSCAPPPSWRSRARSRAWSATTGRSRAATRSSASTRRCARASWCCDCPKCRFVFLALAPFSEPAHLREIFGRDLLDEEGQFEGFALLTATGGHKPFECVGEEQESLAAIRLLAEDPRWSGHRVVRRLVEEVLPRYRRRRGRPGAGARAERRARRAGGADGGGPCGSRSLTAPRDRRVGRRPGDPLVRRAAGAPPAGARRSPWRRSTSRPPEDVRDTLRAPAAQVVTARTMTCVAALSGCDVVVRSPGVSIHRPELRGAARGGRAGHDGHRRCGSPSAAARG